MNVVVSIEDEDAQGRDALPVRALPFVTGWRLSPDVVAKAFALAEPVRPWNQENLRARSLARLRLFEPLSVVTH